jgi:hypothetical protein
MGMPPNLHSVDSSRQPLCVLCKHSGRRATLTHQEIGAFSGNMKYVSELKLKCRNCDGRDYFAWVMRTAQCHGWHPGRQAQR